MAIPSQAVCTSCMTNADAVFWSGAAAVPLAVHAVTRARDRLRGETSRRRDAAYWSNTAFVESLGLDPVDVLGPPPVP
jgi:hypothetical protein